MDKFSELKAAAAKYSAALNAHRENPTDKAALYAWDDAGSELDRAINHKEMEIIIALLAELEEKDKRIIGLERHVKDIEATLVVAADEVADLMKERDEARAKLATPVRLPFYEFAHPLTERQEGYLSAIIDVKGYLRDQGFTV
ncbi:hypothetical protein [Serratia marcescens]|uniref:hypothetical protein n=1 Tax=Serratia marcescens TaxID=615 RepID=UPI001495AC0B|nr:hypothetical protein [Serratia marcescens]